MHGFHYMKHTIPYIKITQCLEKVSPMGMDGNILWNPEINHNFFFGQKSSFVDIQYDIWHHS